MKHSSATERFAIWQLLFILWTAASAEQLKTGVIRRGRSQKQPLACIQHAIMFSDFPEISTRTRNTLPSDSREWFLALSRSGSLQVYEPEGRLLWYGDVEKRDSAPFRAFLQRDANLISVHVDLKVWPYRETVVWKSDHVEEDHTSYFFGVSCDGEHVVIAESDSLEVVWSQEVIPDPKRGQPAEPIVVLRSGEPIFGETFGSAGSPQSGYVLQGDGVIYSKYTVVFTDSLMDEYRTCWSSSPASEYPFPREGHKYQLNEKNGSLEVVDPRDGSVFFTTNNPPNSRVGSPYKLILTHDCIFSIIGDDEKVVWTNNRGCPLSTDDPPFRLLQRGEMFHFNPCSASEPCYQVLYLQLDCNFVHYEGLLPPNLRNGSAPSLWTSGTSMRGEPTCYVYADDDRLRMYEGMFDRSRPNKDLHGDNRIIWEAEPRKFGEYRRGGGGQQGICEIV